MAALMEDGTPLAVAFRGLQTLGRRPVYRSTLPVASSLNSLGWPPYEKRRLEDGTWSTWAGFNNKSLPKALDALETWPLDASGDWTFAHYIWLVCWPCLEWISGASGEMPVGPWHARLQSCSQLLQHDLVGLDEGDSEMDVHGLAAFCASLIQAHLSVCVCRLTCSPLFSCRWCGVGCLQCRPPRIWSS